jgi:hypothetical protein
MFTGNLINKAASRIFYEAIFQALTLSFVGVEVCIEKISEGFLESRLPVFQS